MAVYYTAPVKKTNALSLNCASSDYKLDIGEFTPPRAGLTFAALYLNVDGFKLADPDKPARLRVFMRRAAWNGQSADDTYFDDIWLPTDRSGWGTLSTRVFFEWADKGRPLSWRYDIDGAKSCTLSTRFVKYVQVT